MTGLYHQIKRNTKVFFKDKGAFFSSLIAPLIILFLFITFLGNVYRDTVYSVIPEGFSISEELVEGFVGGWLLSSLLAVCCITVAFSANMAMVQDKVTGVLNDFMITPVRPSVLGLGYYISTALITTIICCLTLGVGLIYLALVGWYLSVSDVILLFADVFLLVLFGTALSSVVCFFLNSQGGITAVSTLVSATYGFLCGAYMPISQFSSGIQTVISFLPGTYGTSLLRNRLMNGVMTEVEKQIPTELSDGLREAFDLKMSFLKHPVGVSEMYIILGAAVILLIFVYILLYAGKNTRHVRKSSNKKQGNASSAN